VFYRGTLWHLPEIEDEDLLLHSVRSPDRLHRPYEVLEGLVALLRTGTVLLIPKFGEGRFSERII
jgi:hypothetical protein